MLKNRFLISGLMFFVLFTITSKAQNFNDALRLARPDLGNDAVMLGIGNSGVSLGLNYASSLINPAGLGLLNRMQISGGLSYNSIENNATFFNKATNFSNSNTNLDQFGIVFPVPTYRGSLVFAFGYNRYKDFNAAEKFNGFNFGDNSMIQYLTDANDNTAYQLGLSYGLFDQNNNYIKDTTRIAGMLNQSGNIITNGDISALSFSGAVEVAKNVFFGATLNLLSGNYNRNREYYEDDTKNVYSSIQLDPSDSRTFGFQTFYLNDILNWDINGWGLKLGLIYKLNNKINIGGTIKLPSQYTIKEVYSVNARSDFGSGTSFELQPPIRAKQEYDISTPYEFEGGASAVVSSVILSGGVKYIDYTQMKYTGGLPAQQTSDNNRQILDLFRGVLNYNFGVQYQIPKLNLILRAGYMYLQSPFKNDPAKYDRKYYTGGIGINTSGSLSLNLAYIRGSWSNFSDNYGSGVSRVYEDISRDKVVFTVAYKY